MKPLVTIGLTLVLASAVHAQQPPEEPPPDARFLVDALRHRGAGIREAAAAMLLRKEIEALPPLLEAVARSDALHAVRAAVVLVTRLDQLRRVPAAEPIRLKLTEEERKLVRQHLLPLVQDPRRVPWRWYLAVYLLDKLDQDSLKDAVPALRVALRPGTHPMKQYAAVQALYRLGPDGREAEEDLWNHLAGASGRFHGLFVAQRVLLDDAAAYTVEIGPYDVLFELEASFVIQELFVSETLRRMGASPARLTALLGKLCAHDSQEVRLETARQLGLLDAPAKRLAASVLIRLLREYDSVLTALLADESSETRDETIELFARLDDAAVAAVPALAELLSADEARLRRSAAVTLERIGPGAADALPALERALQYERLRDSDDYRFMEDAIEAIKKEAEKKEAE